MLFQLFGRFHPLIVHLPIGILLVAFVFEMLSWIKSLKKLKAAVQPALLIGAMASLIAVLTGLTLAEEGGYDEELLSMHRNLGITTAIVSFLAYFLRSRTISADKILRKRVRLLLLLPVVLFVSLTGHWGGSITHGEDYLTAMISISNDETAGQVNFDSIGNVDEAVMYSELVQPILKAKCYSCHSSAKQKGALRLDGAEFIVKGGKHGDVVVRGVSDSSALYHRLTLPVENKKHMPPEEKPQLSSAEIDIIRSWVSDGYSFDKKVSSYNDRDKIREFVAAIQSISQQVSWVPSAEVSEASAKTIQSLTDIGILVMPVAQGSNYLMANFVNARSATDKELELLLPLKDQLLWLNVEKTKISNVGLQAIGKLSNLRFLYLNNTSINDEGIEKLSGLQELTYLNLVGTGFSDRSLNTLRKLGKLKSLYVFDTEVSGDSIHNFVINRGKLATDTGRYSVPFLPTDTVEYKTKPR